MINFERTRWFFAQLLAVFCLFSGGCTWTDAGGTHHLIVGIGFGVVTTTNRPGLDVRDDHVLGVEAGPDGIGAGWLGHHQVVIDPVLASNVVVSIRAMHSGLTVKNFDLFGQNATNKQSITGKDTKAKL